MLVFLFILLAIIVIFIVGSSAVASLSAAPWVPVWKKDVTRILEIADIQPGEVVYDLGCGDGRILVEAVKNYGAQVKGVEIAILPYLASKIRILFTGTWRKSKIKLGNLFYQDLSQADVIVCFLSSSAMQRLAKKLDKELKPGARVVSYAFPINAWHPVKVNKPNSESIGVYLYKK